MPSSLPDLAGLLPSWQLAMRAERKSPRTIGSYSEGVKAFLKWCAASGTPPELTKTTVQAFIGALLDNGAEGGTMRARHMALRRYAAWLADEGELDANPLDGMKLPKADIKVTEALTDDQLRRLIKACAGKGFRERRDEAIVRLLAECGLRAAELIGLQVADVNLQDGLATVRRGKGAKGRVVPFGPQTAAALDRYLRVRGSHRLAETGPLWLGQGGQTFGYHGLDKSLKERAQVAGIEKFHLHLMRNTAATRWLRAGRQRAGSDVGRRVDTARHVGPLHAGVGVRTGRRRGPQPRAGRPVTDWPYHLLGPDGARALITARCARCYRVAAKYWEHNNQGAWIAPNHSRTRTIEEILDDDVRTRNMVAARVCWCDPPPALPTGDELAALVDRARTNLQHRNNIRDRRSPERGWAPVTIRV